MRCCFPFPPPLHVRLSGQGAMPAYSSLWYRSGCASARAAPTAPLAADESGGEGVSRTRVAVYGGSFSPVTVGHLEVAAELVNTGVVDQVRHGCVCLPPEHPPSVHPCS